MAQSRAIVILGATGSIGTQTLAVCKASAGRLRPIGLSAHSRWQELFSLARSHGAERLVITDPALEDRIDPSSAPAGARIAFGASAAERLAADPDADVVVAAMVGAAGLWSTVAALRAGKTVALANKETLVVGGPVVIDLVRQHDARLLPVDSEHSAIFQCIALGRREEIRRVYLTGSGGPFRKLPLEEFERITPAQALQHPTWKMGPKITIDSATMMNKALEYIEAHWLFGLAPEQIEVVLHPQSIVHSMVEMVDGGVFAQASPPDMRLPIQYALTYPERCESPARKLGFDRPQAWEFEPPDRRRYPALELGERVVRRGGSAGCALNAANEVAVERFLAGSIRFPDIVRLCDHVLERHPFDSRPTLEALERIDAWARQEARTWTST